MPFTKLCVRSGSGYVSLPKDDLRMDGLLDEDGDVVEGREMHVQRAGDGTFIVRVVEDGGVPELEECEVVQRAAASLFLNNSEN